MSLWSDYIQELRGPGFREFLEYPDCFAVYSIPKLEPWNDCVIIHDMYVKPELRKQGRGSVLLDDIAEIGRKAGRSYIAAELELGTLSFESAFRSQIAAGFVPFSAQNGIIVMRKEITNG